MPAFLVPFMFVLDPSGQGLLLKLPQRETWLGVAWITVTAFVGIAALAGGVQNWFLRKTIIERMLPIVAGLLLVYPKPLFDFIGIALVLVVVVLQKMIKPGSTQPAEGR